MLLLYKMSRALNSAWVVQPNQLVDPVLSLSNVLQKAMHVRCHHHVAALQDVKGTQLCMGRAAESAG